VFFEFVDVEFLVQQYAYDAIKPFRVILSLASSHGTQQADTGQAKNR
jgi:hypothetical protein